MPENRRVLIFGYKNLPAIASPADADRLFGEKSLLAQRSKEALRDVAFDELLPEWRAVFNVLPPGKALSALEIAALCPFWWRSQGQLAHALRTMADRGLLTKPKRGLFMRPTE